MGLYGLLGATVLLLTISTACAFHFGVIFSIFLTLCSATLVLSLAWVLGSGLITLNDACTNAENIILTASQKNPQMYTLLQLYLKNIGTSLPAVLRAANMVDTAIVSAGLQVASNAIVNNVLSKYLVQYKLAGVLLDLDNLLGEANDQVG